MSSVATVMLVDLVGEASGLAVGAALAFLLEVVSRLGCSCGLVSQQHRVSGPVAIGDVDTQRLRWRV